MRELKMKLLSGIILSLCLGNFLTGCAPYQVRGYITTPPERYEDVTIIATDAALARLISSKKIAVANQRLSWTSDGRLKVLVEIDNRSGRALDVQIQTIFKDKYGNMLEDQTSWEPIVLPRAASTLYTATALDKRAEKFLIRIRLDIPR